eukprot:c50962_g1_i1 orf=68-277(+)
MQPQWTSKYGFQWFPKGKIMRHLGFPVGVAISTFQRAEWAIQRMERKFQYWNSRPLTFGGRLTVVKHVP